MSKKIIFYSFILLIALSSCGSYKQVPYFQDLNRNAPTSEQVANFSPLTIRPGDILGINVTSRNPESSAIFNFNLNRVNGGTYDNSVENPVAGYTVDPKGEIHLPLVGNMKVSGLTTLQFSEKLSQSLTLFYKDPVVNIRLLNFKIAVYGDVLRPNVYTVQNERVTVTQALSLAGDLNITGIRTNVILVREQDGKRNFIPIDLTSKNLFASPYYYLQNNDELYVQPDRTRYATVDRGYRIATLVLSGLSIIAIVVASLHR